MYPRLPQSSRSATRRKSSKCRPYPGSWAAIGSWPATIMKSAFRSSPTKPSRWGCGNSTLPPVSLVTPRIADGPISTKPEGIRVATQLRVIHYLNQFFGGIGGEDKADARPTVKTGPVGPGVLLQKCLGESADVVATGICGDSYFNEHTDDALAEVMKLIAAQKPDLVVAGPAFAAGRYGVACGAVCSAVKERLNLSAVTAMFPENPGVDLYRRRTYILPAGNTAMDMGGVMARLAAFALKLGRGEPAGPADVDGYLRTGMGRNAFNTKSGAERLLEMLRDRMYQRPFTSEVQWPQYDQVSPAAALSGLENATIGLVT